MRKGGKTRLSLSISQSDGWKHCQTGGQGVKTWQGSTVSLCISMWMHGWDNKGERGFDLKGFILKEHSSWRREIDRKLHTMGLQVSFSLSDFPSFTYTSLLFPPSFLTLLMYILIMCKFFLHVCKKKYFYIKSLCQTSAKIGRQYSENTLQGKVRG